MGIQGSQYMIHPQPRMGRCCHSAITRSQITHRPLASGERPRSIMMVWLKTSDRAPATMAAPAAMTSARRRLAPPSLRRHHSRKASPPHTIVATVTVAERVSARVSRHRADHTTRWELLIWWSRHRTTTQMRVSRATKARGLRLPIIPWIGPP